MNLDAVGNFATSCMTCEGRITIPDSGAVWDDTLGIYVPGPDIIRYAGRLLVYAEDRSQDVTAGAAEYHTSRYIITLPAGADVSIGNTLTITASPGNDDLLGETFTIVDVPENAWQVAQQCIAVSTTP